MMLTPSVKNMVAFVLGMAKTKCRHSRIGFALEAGLRNDVR